MCFCLCGTPKSPPPFVSLSTDSTSSLSLSTGSVPLDAPPDLSLPSPAVISQFGLARLIKFLSEK
jgi:hypothetical protein